jgi:hypothetical protein
VYWYVLLSTSTHAVGCYTLPYVLLSRVTSTRTHTHAHTHTHTLQASTPAKEAELLAAATKGDMTKALTLLKAGVSIDCRDGVCVCGGGGSVFGWVGG